MLRLLSSSINGSNSFYSYFGTFPSRIDRRQRRESAASGTANAFHCRRLTLATAYQGRSVTECRKQKFVGVLGTLAEAATRKTQAKARQEPITSMRNTDNVKRLGGLFLRNARALLLTMIPFVWGYIPARFVQSAWVDAYYFRYIRLWDVAFIIMWGWVGWNFGRLRLKPRQSFLLGNMTWSISLCLLVWQFFLLGDAERSSGWLSLLPQLFPFGVLSTTSRTMGIFTRSISSSIALLLAHFYMLVIFWLGFVLERRRQETEDSVTSTWEESV